MIDFSQKLKTLREQRNLSQSELARHLHISRSMISSYETMLRMPSYDVLIKISSYFNVSIDYLLGVKREDTLNISNLSEEQKEVLRNLVTLFNKTE